MRYHSILFPSPEQEAQAGNCPWLSLRPRRAGEEGAYVTRGNKTYPVREKHLTNGPPTPAFFADTGLDSILDEVLAGRDDGALRRVFYALATDAQTVRFRQAIMRALETEEIYGLFLPFARAVEGALRTIADGRKAHVRAQADAYTVGGALEYCNAIRALLKAASRMEIPSEGLGAFVQAVGVYAQTPGFTQTETLLRHAMESINAITYTLRIRSGRVVVCPGRQSGDLVREIREDLIALDENGDDAQPRDIRLFGELDFNPLGTLITGVLQAEHPGPFALLHSAAEAAACLPEPFIRTFTEEIHWYDRYLDQVRMLRAKGLPFAYPALSGGEVRIIGAYDMDLAFKQDVIIRNDCLLSADESGILVTGANHSGKTTYIRALGQIAALTALGLPVPCVSAALPLFHRFFSHFSDAEEGGAGQGRLLEELHMLKPVCEQADCGSLVLLNEMFSSTTAQDAQELAERVLDDLTGKGARVLCVTHHFARVPQRMVSMAAQVAPKSHERLFTIIRAPAETHAHVDALIGKYGLTCREIKERIGHGV